jgi:hypothetical protein
MDESLDAIECHFFYRNQNWLAIFVGCLYS